MFPIFLLIGLVICVYNISKYNNNIMAKKTSFGDESSVLNLIDSMSCGAEVISKAQCAQIREFIPTGNYALNACISGSIFKGVPTGKIITLAGDPGTGKSFLALSICRNAQKMGYTPVYLDSEGAVDIDTVVRLGVDPNKFVLKQVSTILETSSFISNLADKITQSGKDEKLILVLDSLGMLSSDKEVTDTMSGNKKQDMTKQKEIRALFRVNTSVLNRLQIPLIVCAHTYDKQDLFGGKEISGGGGIKFSSSIMIQLSTAKLDDKGSDKIAQDKNADVTKTGVLVTAKPAKSRFCKPIKVKFQIPFFKKPNPYVGLEQYITWESCGIMRGKCFNEKEYDKLKDNEKAQCKSFVYKEETLYALPKDTARTLVVTHLGGEVPLVDLLTSKVMTDELLHHLDETVIRPLFELPTQDSNDDIDEYMGVAYDDGE